MPSKDLSVIFPIYNEEETIEKTLLEWKKTLDSLKINYELILAEDGSTDNTKKILQNAIKLGGSSIKDFSSSNGKKGSFQQHFNVYGKNGEICTKFNCKSKIKKTSISKRATFFCLKCQK